MSVPRPRSSTFQSDAEGWEEQRRALDHILHMPVVEHGIAVVVLASMIVLIIETDMTAQTASTSPKSPLIILIVNKVFVLIFVVETGLRVYIQRLAFFTKKQNILDALVTLFDFLLSIADLALAPHAEIPQIAFLRCFRLARLLRFWRIIKHFPELGFLVEGIVSAFATVAWGMIMVLLILLMWSLLAVQLLHPVNLTVEANGIYADCSRCPRAFSSVWNSFLTFSQTLVFGDSWGAVALPVIEEAPWTLLIFLLAFASVGLAAMNLILAAIVDSGAQSREAAISARSAAAKKAELEEHRRQTENLLGLCKELDDDESGRLSKQELMQGYDRNQKFQEAIQSMSFGRDDIEVFFHVLDKDRSGDVDYSEFLEVMQFSKDEKLQHMVTFVKFAVLDMWRLRHQDDQLRKRLDDLLGHLEDKSVVSSTQDGGSEVQPSPANREQPQQLLQQQSQQRVISHGRGAKRDASTGPGQRRGSRKATEDLAGGAKDGPKKELNDLPCQGVVPVPTLAGDWQPLDSTFSSTTSSALDHFSELRNQNQELLRLVKRLVHHTEDHTRILGHLDRTIASHPAEWQQEGVPLRSVALQVASTVEAPPPPPPPSAQTMMLSRLGL